MNQSAPNFVHQLELTGTELNGVQHALVCARSEYEAMVPDRELRVAYWHEQTDCAEYLKIAEENLAYAREKLALVLKAQAAVNRNWPMKQVRR